MATRVVEYSEEFKQWLKSECNFRDEDKTGYLDKRHLREVLEVCTFNVTDEGLAFIVKYFDTNGDGQLSIKEIVENIDAIAQHCMDGEDFAEAFKMLDIEGQGFIRLPHLKKIMLEHGENPMSPAEASKLLDDMVRQFDRNHDGKFDYPEFLRFMKSDLYEKAAKKQLEV